MNHSNRTLLALCVVFFVTTAAFASLFAWQYVKDDDDRLHIPNTTAPTTTSQPSTNGCPFYPIPQKIDLDKHPQFSTLFKWMEDYLNSTVDATSRPSVTANLVYLDQVVWKGSFGKISKTVHQSPTENTIYRIASISKTFPVLYLFKLWEDGMVNLYDPVTKYAPDFAIEPLMGKVDDINLIDLASQLSGLPGALPFNLSGSAIVYHGDLDGAFGLLKDQTLVAEPRTKCIYSNMAYALLGDILARNFSGGNFTDWAKRNVVDPLQLTNTGFRYTQDVISKMATGYLPSGAVAPVYDLGWYGPAGNYYSTAADLAKFSMSFLETSKTILKHDTISEMMRPRKNCQHGYIGGLATMTGSPWEIAAIDDNLIVRKDGDLEGYSSTMAMVPDLKLAFNVLMSGTRGENVARKVLQEVIPIFRDVLRSKEQQITPTPNPEKYTGRFSYYRLQTQVIKEGSGGVLLMENHQAPAGRFNTTGLSYVDEGLFRMFILGPDGFPCPLDPQNGAIMHFRDYENGMYNIFDYPELSVYGFKRL